MPPKSFAMQLSLTELSDKRAARSFFRKKRGVLLAEEHGRLSAALCDCLYGLLSGMDIQTVLMFFPVKGEPDILPLAQRLTESGKQIAFPISHTETCTLEFKTVVGTRDLITGAYGIPEPPTSAKTLTDTSRCACLVPALGFDSRGMRIGYGKGYYDRFLAHFEGVSVGVAFSGLVVDRLPCDPTDIAVKMIVTERGVILPDETQKKHSGQATPEYS